MVDRLAKDLGTEFPGVEGFSLQILQLAAKLPWGHHMVLLDRLKAGQSREWYLQASIEHGWSRNTLTHHISTQLREREGKALTNFSRTLPETSALSAIRKLVGEAQRNGVLDAEQAAKMTDVPTRREYQ